MRHDAGHHLFVAHRIGRGDDGDLPDGRMVGERRFDFEGRDVLARATDDVLAAVDEVDLPVLATPHDVASMQPAAAPGVLRGFLILEIAGEEADARIRAGVTHQQLPRRALGRILSRIFDDAQLDARARCAYAARADVTRLAARGDGGAAARFGHRPGFDQRKTEARLESLVVLRIHVGAKAEANAVRPLVRIPGLAEQDRGHHAEVVHDGGAAGRDVGPPCLRMETVELHDATARQDHGCRRDRERVHVEKRERRDQALFPGAYFAQSAF